MRMADVKMLKRVGFIGAGQMAEALARGFIAKGVLQAGDITANDPSAERKKVFQSFDAKAAASNIEVGHGLCSRLLHQASKTCCHDSSYLESFLAGCGKQRDRLSGCQAAVCAAGAEGSPRAPDGEAHHCIYSRRQDAGLAYSAPVPFSLCCRSVLNKYLFVVYPLRELFAILIALYTVHLSWLFTRASPRDRVSFSAVLALY